MSTIALDPDVKKSLKEFKITENESYNSIIKRLIVEVKKKSIYKCSQKKRILDGENRM